MGYDLTQNEAVDDQKQQSGEPDQDKCVVAFKLQEVGGGQPESLSSKPEQQQAQPLFHRQSEVGNNQR